MKKLSRRPIEVWYISQIVYMFEPCVCMVYQRNDGSEFIYMKHTGTGTYRRYTLDTPHQIFITAR